ncbi:hypothetical protein SCHIN_v1c05180 [Spiroplasma chinense]|uniref:MOLPALP family lipoprotein n=1 Tax=Spiroplasma chinense TaxID=216932 RepID=A0A5B9Y4I1_9MOLU|nr:hypothetical protein [Spiroplasma chinense]QEH61715.1 hypothetical protein SCHIN_v1c05180 [Spiroplasma chinense]
MKKLLALLSSASILVSAASVSACSLVNHEKEYIKNKVKQVVENASVAIRAAIASDTNNVNVNYAGQYLNGNYAKDVMDNFGTSTLTKVDQLVEGTFGKTLDKNYFVSIENTNLNLEGTKTATTSFDEIGGTISMVLSLIQTAGGIEPSLVGSIKGLLPTLLGLIGNNFDLSILDSLGDVLADIKPVLSTLFQFASNSDLFELIVSSFLSVDFSSSDVGSIVNSIFKFIINLFSRMNSKAVSIIDNYVNEIMLSDYKDETITQEDIQREAAVRLNNAVARIFGKSDKVVEINSDVIKNFNSTFLDEKLATTIGEIFSGGLDNLDIIGLISSLKDIFFIIGAVLIRPGIIELDSSLSDENHLLSSSKTNKEFLDDFSASNFEKNFSFKKAISNLKIATNIGNDKNGLGFRKLALILLNSNSSAQKVEMPDDHYLWTSWLANNFSSVDTPDNILSMLIHAIGFNLPTLLNLDLGSLKDTGAMLLGNFIPYLVDKLTNNESLVGLVELLKSFNVDLPFPDPEILRNSYDAIWSPDSSFLSDLLQVKINGKNINLYNLLTITNDDGLTLYDALTNLYSKLNTGFKNTTQERAEQTSLEQGIDNLTNALKNANNITIYYKKAPPGNSNSIYAEGKNLIEALKLTSENPGLGFKYGSDVSYGSDGAMSILGYDEKTKTFRDNSLLKGLQLIFRDKDVINCLASIMNGFKVNSVKKQNYITEQIAKPLDKTRYKTKNIKNNGLSMNSFGGTITYNLVYNDVETGNKYMYKVGLQEEQDGKWNIFELNRV